MEKNNNEDRKKVFNLLLGLAGPYGSGCSSLAEELEREIKDWPGCFPVRIHVVDLIERVYPFVFDEVIESGENKAKQRRARQKAGTRLRKEDPEYVGKLICAEIHQRVLDIEENERLNSIETLVFIIDSIKNSHEVTLLRRVFSDEFNLIFVHADRATRWRRMRDYKGWEKTERVIFEDLDQIDQDEKSTDSEVADHGQQVSKLSAKADYYVANIQNREKLKEDGKRFLDILFGDGRNQPSIHERSMHIAFSASNRSFCLSRQVGASIIDSDGNLLGLGHNDVPSALGGLYSQESAQDKRCYLVGDRRCSNQTTKETRFAKLSEDLIQKLEIDEEQAEKIKKIISLSEFKDSTEYCRAVHAEMEAILSVARIGRGTTKGCSMYVTTEPCHNCTKHIVAAGLTKVYFIEPYPKSLLLELHSDSIELGPTPNESNNTKVSFIPYQGVGPQRFHDFFTMDDDRKDSNGHYRYRSREEQSANPRFARSLIQRSRCAEQLDPITLKESIFFSEISMVYKNKAKEIKTE